MSHYFPCICISLVLKVFVLRKRIAELEAENQVLSERLAEVIRANKTPQISLLDAPTLPSTPMPSGPPPGISANPLYSTPRNTQTLEKDPFSSFISTESNNQNRTNSTANDDAQALPQSPPICPLPSLAPPPPIAPRRYAHVRVNAVPAPEVGRRLENLQLDNMEDVFDDEFDPRADRVSKKQKEYDPFGDDFLDDILETGNSASRATMARTERAHPTPDDFQVMIDKVDKRLAEMSSAFSGDGLEMGHVSPGESLGDFDNENEYGTPVDKVNSVVMTGKKT
ncbi:hypothetical protein DICVIV_05231 [Dictyocaulus viviparus]|uniref:Uncharacterized protein n=1 Tax=Dictyocaulus viviparus TaxID=29172 RepID=A0A0D8XXY4_DICVI|nr:hypothetical protein DICVIV_05231 [Dictyocaulus viviparus]